MPTIIDDIHTVLLALLAVQVTLQSCRKFLLLPEELQLLLVDLAVLIVETVPDGLGWTVDEKVSD